MKQAKINGKTIGTALIIMILGSFAFCALIGVLVEKQAMPENMGWLLALGLTELLVLLVTYWAARRVPQRRLPMTVLLAGLFLGIRLLLGVAAFPGEGIQAARCLLTLGVAVAAGLMASTKKQRRR